LWKSAENTEEIGWDSPWGRGRPGWHIECSAMSMKYLGENFDIHGGGMDLLFPHHENEIAQSETATNKPFAKYWMHNGLTRVKTKATGGEWKAQKMSKSLGNIKPLSELLTEFPPDVIRFFLLSTHYRRPIDFSDEAIEAVQKGMMNLYRLLERVEWLTGQDVYNTTCSIEQLKEKANTPADQEFIEMVTQVKLRYLEALDDDFNTAGAIAVLHDLCTGINRYIDQQRQEIQARSNAKDLVLEAARMLTSLGQALGLLTGPLETQETGNAMTEQLMELLIELRTEARQQ